MNRPRFIVVTPARNEQDNIIHTIRSMAAQSWLPELWIIVDDGSTDATGMIIDSASREYPWILAIHRADRGFRKQGGGVVDTFYDGYDKIGGAPWDFLVKFDADLSFAPDYFEKCLQRFEDEPQLGIGGGMICHPKKGRLACESPGDPAFHVRGATKIYRKACWDSIGGLLRAPGWDTVDEMKANMLGWKTLTFVELHLTHHRFTGTADGTWKNHVKFGLANYITGYHPLFMAVKCLIRTVQKPYIVGAVGLWWGFTGGYLRHIARINDPDLVRYIRRQQLNKLTLRPSLW